MKKPKNIEIPQDYFIQETAYTADKKMYYDIKKIELIENVGALVHIKNATHPKKGIPAAAIVMQVNILKEYIKQKNLLDFLCYKKSVDKFINFFEKCFYPYRVKIKYMCPAAVGVYSLVLDVLVHLNINPTKASQFAYYFAHLFEFDDAYRYRLQDIFTTISVPSLYKNPSKELRRVFNISLEREEHPAQKIKMAKIYSLICILVKLPSVKKALRLVDYFDLLRFDEADVYWAGFKDNYKFLGVTHEEHKSKNKIPVMGY